MKREGHTKAYRIYPLGTMNVHNSMEIHAVVAEIFPPGTKRWTYCLLYRVKLIPGAKTLSECFIAPSLVQPIPLVYDILLQRYQFWL